MVMKEIESWKSNIPDEWILKLGKYNSDSFISASSSGYIRQHYMNDISSGPSIELKRAHESSINDMKISIDGNISTCSTDGVKVWDLRSAGNKPQFHLTNNNNSNFLSLAFSSNILAAGTELQGTDAELHMWDLRNTAVPIKSFIDSHHDDVTAIEFHPSKSSYLMSGSTDGYVNIYDLTQEDEDDALHQVINFDSVHSCHFTQENRIAVLSHIETLSFYELNSTNYEIIEEPVPKNFGDLRGLWDNCEYIVDLYNDGYIAYGANSKSSLVVVPFVNRTETFDMERAVSLPNAHGEEVVRDTLYDSHSDVLFSAGEDGFIKLWRIPLKLYETELTKGQANEVASAFGDMKDTSSKSSRSHKNKSKRINKKRDKKYKPY